VRHRWYRRGERPPGLADNRFTFAYIYGAVRAGPDDAFALVMPEVSTATMHIFLDRFAQTLASDEHAPMILEAWNWNSGESDIDGCGGMHWTMQPGGAN
jgi:hypothetical protein